MKSPPRKRKGPAERLSTFLGSEHNMRILAWVGTITVSFIARELLRWLLNVMRS